jgi:hypothetical protein
VKYTLVWWPSEALSPAINQLELSELSHAAAIEQACAQINDAHGYGEKERLTPNEPHIIIALFPGWHENHWLTI